MAKKEQGSEHVSYKAKDVQQAGLLDDCDVEVTDAAWVMWDYNGKAPQENPALKVTVQPESGGDEVELFLSAGSAEHRVPSDDGEQLVKAEGSNATGLPRGCNAEIFLASLESAGFEMENLDEGFSKALKGLGFHLLRITAPVRKGLTVATEDGKKKYENTIPTVQKINYLPGEKKGGGAKAGGSTKKGSTPAPGFDDEDVQAVIMEVLEENEDGLALGKLTMQCFKKLADNPARKAIVEKLQDKEYVKGLGFKIDNKGIVTLE